MYALTKQRESQAVISLALECCLWVTRTYFPDNTLCPGVGAADHSAGIRAGWMKVFPDLQLEGCWPHIAWGLSHGKLLAKSHPRWSQVQLEFQQLHKAHTVGMWDVLTDALYAEWGDDDSKLNALWNSYLCGDGANWYLGFPVTPAAPPSQQTQEGWHNHAITQRLQSLLLVGMHKVLSESLAKVVQLDGKRMC